MADRGRAYERATRAAVSGRFGVASERD